MAKKRIPIDKERFETLKNELVRVSNIDLSSDNAYSDLCDYIKKQSNTNFPLPKYEDGSVIQQSETISVDTLRRIGEIKMQTRKESRMLENYLSWLVL